MKKVLFVTVNDWVTWGGSEVLWAKACLIALEENFNVSVCLKKWPQRPEFVQKLSEKGAILYERNMVNISKIDQFKNRFLPSKFHKRNTKILAYHFIEDLKPDLVIISQGGNSEGEFLARHLASKGIAYVTISQAVSEAFWPNDVQCAELDVALKGAKMNFFVSKDNLITTERQIGRYLPNAQVTWNPFNVPFENSLAYPSTENGFRIACVARYEFSAKGQDILCAVLSQPKWKARNLSVHFYGSGTNELGLKKLISMYGIEKQAYVEGYASTLDIWKQNHALILPSRVEGLPLSLVEAMLCARLSIVTNVSGNLEAIQENINAFVAEAPRYEYIDAALERAWDRKDEWQSMGESAQVHIKKIVPVSPELAFWNSIKTLF
jgi:glycosyltransferase involved in cell wall biosynthesis